MFGLVLPAKPYLNTMVIPRGSCENPNTQVPQLQDILN